MSTVVKSVVLVAIVGAVGYVYLHPNQGQCPVNSEQVKEALSFAGIHLYQGFKWTTDQISRLVSGKA